MYWTLILVGLIVLAVCIAIKVIGEDKFFGRVSKKEKSEIEEKAKPSGPREEPRIEPLKMESKGIDYRLKPETEGYAHMEQEKISSQSQPKEVTVKLSGETLGKFHQSTEWNKDQRHMDIKSSLSFMNVCLFVIAVALCVIAFCAFYDFLIKYQIVETYKEVINETNILAQDLWNMSN